MDEVEEDEISEEEPMYAQPVEQRDTGESSGAPDSLTPAVLYQKNVLNATIATISMNFLTNFVRIVSYFNKNVTFSFLTFVNS